MRYFVIIGLVCLMVLSGCAGKEITREKTAQELADEGTKRFQDGDYMRAVESFDRLKDWYPFSNLASMAELKIADSYYHMKKYDEAIQWYMEFENLHPNNEAIPYVIYQTGRCYFNQLESIDRDPTFAEKSIRVFNRLIREYPDTSYAIKAVHHIDKCYKRLAGHELYVGMYYFKEKNYKAALERFKNVITNFPDVGVHQKALAYITACEESIQKYGEQYTDDGINF